MLPQTRGKARCGSRHTRDVTVSNGFFRKQRKVIFLISLYAQNEIWLMEQMEAVSVKYKKEKVWRVWSRNSYPTGRKISVCIVIRCHLYREFSSITSGQNEHPCRQLIRFILLDISTNRGESNFFFLSEVLRYVLNICLLC